MNALEKVQRLLKAQQAFPTVDWSGLIDPASADLPDDAIQQRMQRGLATEGRFADVYSGLEWTALVHGLDQWQLPARSKDTWQVPDHVLFVQTPDRDAAAFAVDVKHVSGQKVTFEISTSLLGALERYADTCRMPLLLAVFWEKLHLWTLTTPDQLERSHKTSRIGLEDATRSDLSVICSDTLVRIRSSWRRRSVYDPDATGYHLHHPDRGFLVEDHLAIDGENFVELTEVESGLVNHVMRPKVLDTTKDGRRCMVTTASTGDAYTKASSVMYLLLEEFDAFGEESAPERAFNTLVRWKLKTGIEIAPHLPARRTAQTQRVFNDAFGFQLTD